MLDLHLLPLFFSAVVVLLIIPGPDMLLIAAQSVSHGARFGVACSLGVLIAGLLQTALVALGLGKVMETWPLVASAVQLVGAAYMAWLGVQLIRGWFANKQTALSTPKPASASYSRLVLIGAANNLLNPKALLFFSFFLPQFVNPAMGKPSLQLFLLGLMLSVTAFVFNVLLALTASALRRFDLGAAPLQRHSGGLLGGLFMLLAARLALAKPA